MMRFDQFRQFGQSGSSAGLDFQPALLQLQRNPPHPLAHAVLYALLGLLALLLIWSAIGELDIVAVAEGKLVPASYLKIVQPAEQGIVREILVQEGEPVKAGQVLMRMDTAYSEADRKALLSDYHGKRLTLRRIDAQLADRPLYRENEDPPELYEQVSAQYNANVTAYRNALSQERSVLERARHDLAAAERVKAKLVRTLPHYRERETAFDKLAERGYSGRIEANERTQERIEKEQDLLVQESVIQAARAAIAQSEKHIAQITADYLRELQADRVEATLQLERLRQELTKLQHRQELLELKAPQDGVVKDLATHTIGTVTSPGTILMTLVPKGEPLRAEVWVGNRDIGFVRIGQPVKLRLAAFQFQKYGLVDGTVVLVGADAADRQSRSGSPSDGEEEEFPSSSQLAYRTLIDLKSSYLDSDGRRYELTAGMQVSAEIKLGTRTVLEYLLSPLRKAFHEAGRER